MRLLLAFVLAFSVVLQLHAAPANFGQAKTLARQQVYQDQNTVGDLYCQCTWQWTGKSGGRIDAQSCGYQVRKQPVRAARIEWEHIVPASNFGRQRQCWQDGGRKHCVATDPVFSMMEADLHNLAPVVGEVNADRQNFNYGLLQDAPNWYGQCDFGVDFKQRIAQPRPAIRGMVARVTFYMADRYGLRLSQQQEQLYMAWNRAYPPSTWELQRDTRIAEIMGHHNPFVTGERQWVPGYKPTRDGLQEAIVSQPANPETHTTAGPIHGNRNSRIYHLPGCPSYTAMADKKRVIFSNRTEAEATGYRLAGNCR